MDQWGLDHVGGIAKANFPGAKVRLELSTRPSCDDLSGKDVLVPFLGTHSIRGLDMDMMDRFGPGHRSDETDKLSAVGRVW